MRAIGLVLTLVLFGVISAQAEYPSPPLEAYGALPRIADAEISPDGKRVATIANLEDGARMIVFTLSGDAAPKQVGIGKIKARSVEFFDNDHVIFRASKTTKTFGFRGEYEFSGAFAFNLETDKIEQLLRRNADLFPAQGGLGKIVGRGKEAGDVLMPAYMGERSGTPSYDLLRVKFKSPKGRRLLRGTNDTRDWFVGADGNVLARERYNNKSNVYAVEARLNKKWETIYEIEDEILPMSIWGVAPDESGLVFVRTLRNEMGSDVLLKLGFDGEVTGPLLPPQNSEIEAIYTDNNRAILGVRYAGVEPDYAFLDERLQDSCDKVSASLPYGTIELDSWSDDRGEVLYRVFEPSLGDVWLIHRRIPDELALIAKRRPDIPPEAMGTMMNIKYQARDGLDIQAIMTVPPGYDQSHSELLPAIILPHGGPAGYDRFDFDWMAQYFANRGYAVVQPNFRGSTGSGRAFEDAGRGEWGGKMQHDITDGVKALVSAKMIDPDRICIVGASYGGYAALAGAVFTPELYKCAIAIAPVSDLNKMLKDEKKDHGRDHWVISYWEDIMAEGDARRAKLKSISPVNFAENVQAPVLLLHGDDDTVVPISQSTAMRRALDRADKDVELIKLKGEDHWLSVADTRMQTLEAMDAFIAEHLPIQD